MGKDNLKLTSLAKLWASLYTFDAGFYNFLIPRFGGIFSPGNNLEKAPDSTPPWVEALLAEALVTAIVR